MAMKVSLVSWLCMSGPQPGFALQYPRLNPSEMDMAGICEALAPTGEVAASLSVMGGWKPITA